MLVHRAGECGRTAVVGELALQRGELGDGGAVAAELDGDRGAQQPGVVQDPVGVGDEGAVAVVACGVLGQQGAELGGALDEGVRGNVPAAVGGWCRCSWMEAAPGPGPLQSTIETPPVHLRDFPEGRRWRIVDPWLSTSRTAR